MRRFVLILMLLSSAAAHAIELPGSREREGVPVTTVARRRSPLRERWRRRFERTTPEAIAEPQAEEFRPEAAFLVGGSGIPIGLRNVIEDLTPELGGNLAGGAFTITTSGHITIASNSNMLRLGEEVTDYTVRWSGADAIHTILSGDFTFNGGDLLVNTGDVSVTGGVGDVRTNELYVTGDGRKIFFGVEATDFTAQWSGSDAIFTIAAGDFVFSGGEMGIGAAAADPNGILHLDNGASDTDLVIEKDEATNARLVFHRAGGEEANISYNNTERFVMENDFLNEDIVFRVNDGGVDTDPIYIDGGQSQVQIMDPSTLTVQSSASASSTQYPFEARKETTSTGVTVSVASFGAKSSNDIAENFGGHIDFTIQDDVVAKTQIAQINWKRGDTDDSGKMNFNTWDSGVERNQMRITEEGNILFRNDNQILGWGPGGVPEEDSDATIAFDGNSFNIIANAETAGDDLELTADVIQLIATTGTGIGVSDPDELLELFKVGTQLKLSGGAADYATFAVAADGAMTVTTVDTDAALAHIFLQPDGKVAIGSAVATPDGILHLDNGASATILVLEKDDATQAQLLFHSAGVAAAEMLVTASEEVQIRNTTVDADIVFFANDGTVDTELLRFNADVPAVDIAADNLPLRLGLAQDLSIAWDSNDAVFTISAGDFVFTGGMVGIGTAAPSSLLTVLSTGTGTQPFRVLASDASTLVVIKETAGGAAVLEVNDASGTAKVKLNTVSHSYFTGGNLGVNNTDPGEKLEVTGDVRQSGTTGGVNRRVAEATGTATAATTFDVEVDIPAGARILGCQMRVDTVLTSSDGGTTWTAAYIDGSTSQVGTGLAFAKNTKQNTLYDANAASAITSAETDIRITCDAAKTFAAGGVVRVIVYYEDVTVMDNAA